MSAVTTKKSPQIAVIYVRGLHSSESDLSWADLASELDVVAVPSEKTKESLVRQYSVGLAAAMGHAGPDILVFAANSRPGSSAVFREQLEAFWANPRAATLNLASSADNSACGQEFSFCSVVSLSAFAIKTAAIKKAGFLSSDFRHDVGAAEEFTYRLLQAGFLPTCSHRPLVEEFSPKEPDAEKPAYEFAARYFVEQFGRDWDLVISSWLPYDIQRENYFTKCRERWESWLSDHERLLYLRTMYAEEHGQYLTLDSNKLATRLHGIVRLLSARDASDLLHPWYYFLSLDGTEITPGINGLEPAKALDDRKTFMAKMLVDGVMARYDFSGKSVLDAGANCGFFGAIYAQAGASSYTAIEGRLQHVQQGELYWGVNSFVAGSHYEFLHANIDSPEVSALLAERGDFDFVLCSGLLYHLPHPLDTLRRLAQRAKETIVVDTRVSADSRAIEERGGCSFDAIVQTREKINPALKDIVSLLQEEGFVVENITVAEEMTGQVPLVDNYSKGNRVTLYAERKVG